MSITARRQVVLGVFLGLALAYGMVAALTPGSRARCYASMSAACDPGTTPTVTFVGNSLWNRCEVVCRPAEAP